MTHWNAEEPVTFSFRKQRSSNSLRHWTLGSDKCLSYYLKHFLIKVKIETFYSDICTECTTGDKTGVKFYYILVKIRNPVNCLRGYL